MAVPEADPAPTGIKEGKEESPVPKATWIRLNMFEHLLAGFFHLFIYIFIYLYVAWVSKILCYYLYMT